MASTNSEVHFHLSTKEASRLKTQDSTEPGRAKYQNMHNSIQILLLLIISGPNFMMSQRQFLDAQFFHIHHCYGEVSTNRFHIA